MEENNSIESTEEFEQAEVDCSNCVGNWVQVQQPLPKERVFTPVYFVKWRYICQKCGLTSKVFSSRVGNKVQ